MNSHIIYCLFIIKKVITVIYSIFIIIIQSFIIDNVIISTATHNI